MPLCPVGSLSILAVALSFPAAAHFPSRAVIPFLPQHHHPPATSDDDEEVKEDKGSVGGDSGEEDEPELADEASRGRQLQRASSAPGIGRAVMNGDNRARHIQEGHQWQHLSHLCNCGTEQYGCTSSGWDEPGTIPREMRMENGYGVIGRRGRGPASTYWDLLRAQLSDPLKTRVRRWSLRASVVCAAYASQEDMHFAQVTVRQTFSFSAQCQPVREQELTKACFQRLLHEKKLQT